MKLSAGILAIALLAFGTLIPGSARAKTACQDVEPNCAQINHGLNDCADPFFMTNCKKTCKLCGLSGNDSGNGSETKSYRQAGHFPNMPGGTVWRQMLQKGAKAGISDAGNTLLEEDRSTQIDKHVEERYTELLRNCKERMDYHCLEYPDYCFSGKPGVNFDQFKNKCSLLIANTADWIIISSGFNVTEDYYVGLGIYSDRYNNPNNQTRDVILFGVRRPKAGKGSGDDEPLFGFAPKMTRNTTEYKRLDFLHNMFDKSFSKIKPFLERNHPDGPITHMISLNDLGSGLITFKADLGKNKFAVPKKVLKKVPEWKNVEHLNWINMTEPYYYALNLGIHDGKTFTRLLNQGLTKFKLPLTTSNKEQKNVEIDPTYFMPDGSMKP